ncbi:MAG: hypothetical protein U5K54_23650 [Cytophagales bacterium]|nr:hypothetical protein [Cytophagales bacterium]
MISRGIFERVIVASFMILTAEVALKNSNVSNTPEIYNYYELGGTFHVKDFDVSSKTKIFLHKKNTSANNGRATVPLYAEVPSKLRKIYGVRLGGVYLE